MENQTITLHAGALQLPPEVQQTLGLQEGARLTLSVRDGGIFLEREVEAPSREAAMDAIQKLHGTFAEGPGLEDELRKMRLEWEERLERLSA